MTGGLSLVVVVVTVVDLVELGTDLDVVPLVCDCVVVAVVDDVDGLEVVVTFVMVVTGSTSTGSWSSSSMGSSIKIGTSVRVVIPLSPSTPVTDNVS